MLNSSLCEQRDAYILAKGTKSAAAGAGEAKI